MDQLHQSGSLRVVFPHTPGSGLTGVLVNCAGGLTGGDKFEMSAEAGPATNLTLTTQAAERLYRAPEGEPARLATRLTVNDGASLAWLPQETILFDRCRMRRALDVELAADARFLMIEPLLFGRTAMGETLTDASFHDNVRIHRDGVLVHADATRLDGAVHTQLQNTGVTKGGLAVASVVYSAPDTEARLDEARAIIGSLGGASLKAESLLSIRLVAESAIALRRVAVPLIQALARTDIPKPWMI